MSIVTNEAERLYPSLVRAVHGDPVRGGDSVAAYTSDDLHDAYVAGASRAFTDAEIDAAALALYSMRLGDFDAQAPFLWGNMSAVQKREWVRRAAGCLDAARARSGATRTREAS